MSKANAHFAALNLLIYKTSVNFKDFDADVVLQHFNLCLFKNEAN